VKTVSGEVDFRFRIAVDAKVACIRNDSNDWDLAGSGAENSNKDVGAEWVARRKIALRERLVDDEEPVVLSMSAGVKVRPLRRAMPIVRK